MQLMNKGKSVRRSVDAILSIGCVQTPTHPADLKGLFVTFSDIGSYGVYCASVTYGNDVHISLTVMTDNFDTDSFLKNEKGAFEFSGT